MPVCRSPGSRRRASGLCPRRSPGCCDACPANPTFAATPLRRIIKRERLDKPPLKQNHCPPNAAPLTLTPGSAPSITQCCMFVRRSHMRTGPRRPIQPWRSTDLPLKTAWFLLDRRVDGRMQLLCRPRHVAAGPAVGRRSLTSRFTDSAMLSNGASTSSSPHAQVGRGLRAVVWSQRPGPLRSTCCCVS